MSKFHKAKYIFKNGRILENSGIYVSRGRVVDGLSEFETVDHGNAFICPGFVNFHTHLQYADLIKVINFTSVSNKTSFFDWIIALISQYFSWSDEKKIQSLQNGLKETVKSGVTCVVNLGIEDAFIEILNDSGINSYTFLETFSDSEERTDREFKQLMHLLEKYNTFNVGISPHSPYNTHPSMWKKLAETDVLIHTHLFESADEMAWLNGQPSGIEKMHDFVRFKTFEPYNIRQYLEPFGERLIAAHLCQIGFEQAKQYNIAHCPRSNVFLHGKTLDVTNDNGRIGLGTDSRFSNEDLNILHEARVLKEKLSFVQILSMLTINPSIMLNLPLDNADFLVFNLSENESCEAILDRDGPDSVYIKGQKYLP